MAIPHRGRTTESTYFVTANTFEKTSLFQVTAAADLFVDTLLHYREKGDYLLHEFVLMWDHFHLILTPAGITLERSIQFIKGGFSYRAKKELAWNREIWQTSFVDRRVRDDDEYAGFKTYIYQNAVERGLAKYPEEYRYSSASGRFKLDPVPQWLKPVSS